MRRGERARGRRRGGAMGRPRRFPTPLTGAERRDDRDVYGRRLTGAERRGDRHASQRASPERSDGATATLPNAPHRSGATGRPPRLPTPLTGAERRGDRHASQRPSPERSDGATATLPNAPHHGVGILSMIGLDDGSCHRERSVSSLSRTTSAFRPMAAGFLAIPVGGIVVGTAQQPLRAPTTRSSTGSHANSNATRPRRSLNRRARRSFKHSLRSRSNTNGASTPWRQPPHTFTRWSRLP